LGNSIPNHFSNSIKSSFFRVDGLYRDENTDRLFKVLTMTAILLAYSATAYFFSGSVCYLAFLNDLNQDSEPSALKRNASKLTKVWIALLWPMWIISEVKAEDSKAEIRTITPKAAEYSTCRRELIPTAASEMNQPAVMRGDIA